MPRTLQVQMIINKQSEPFLERCLASLSRQKLPEDLHLKLTMLQYEDLGYEDVAQSWIKANTHEHCTIELVARIKRSGFGENHNYLRHLSKQNTKNLHTAFLILNPDTFLSETCILELLAMYDQNTSKAGLVEARQFPSEHPKHFDPLTLETAWCSGACLLIDGATFDSISGFDEHYDMYLEDVDLSWRFWLAGRSCLYQPLAVCGHATGLFWSNPYQFNREFSMTLRNHLLLAWKFFGKKPGRFALLLKQFQLLPVSKQEKNDAIKAYESLKAKVIPVSDSHPMIQIFGLGQYHRQREA